MYSLTTSWSVALVVKVLRELARSAMQMAPPNAIIRTEEVDS
jgi:hypothetical protein